MGNEDAQCFLIYVFGFMLLYKRNIIGLECCYLFFDRIQEIELSLNWTLDFQMKYVEKRYYFTSAQMYILFKKKL